MRPPGPLPGSVLGLKPCSAAKRRARGLMRPTSTGMLAAGIVGGVAAGVPFEAMAPVQSDPPPGAGDTAVATVPVCAAADGALPLLALAAVPVVGDGTGIWGRYSSITSPASPITHTFVKTGTIAPSSKNSSSTVPSVGAVSSKEIGR